MNRLVVGLRIRRAVAAGQMHVFRAQIDFAEQVLLHEGMIAQRILVIDAHVLVQIEGAHAVKVDHAAVIPLRQHLVGGNRRRTGRQAQHAVALAGNLCGNQHARRLAGCARIFVNVKFHKYPP